MKWILVLLLPFVTSGGNQEQMMAFEKRISEHICTTDSAKKIETKELRLGTSKIGYSIWMDATYTKANCLPSKGAFKSVESRFESWQTSNEVVVCTSGGYANTNFTKGIGLTIDQGEILNKLVVNDMDALVIVEKGKIKIHNLNEDFTYKKDKKKVKLTNSLDKAQFMVWAKQSNASIFQTHLLAFENELKVSTRGNVKRAIRKFLVTLTTEKGEKKNVIFYLRYPEYLYAGTKKVFDYLKSQNCQIHAMINLDTGVNDVLELNKSFKTCNNGTIKGRTPINQSTNLIIFYQ